MPCGRAFFRTEYFGNSERALERPDHDLFIKLRRGRQICGFVIIIFNLECRRAAFGITTDECTNPSRIAAVDGNGRGRLFLQRLGNTAEPLVDISDLAFESIDLWRHRRVQEAGRCSAFGALNHGQLVAGAKRREQRELETMSAAFDACRDRHPVPPMPSLT